MGWLIKVGENDGIKVSPANGKQFTLDELQGYVGGLIEPVPLRKVFEAEPDIYNAIKEGALLENVVYDNVTKEINFNDNKLKSDSLILNQKNNSAFAKGNVIFFDNQGNTFNTNLDGKSLTIKRTSMGIKLVKIEATENTTHISIC